MAEAKASAPVKTDEEIQTLLNKVKDILKKNTCGNCSSYPRIRSRLKRSSKKRKLAMLILSITQKPTSGPKELAYNWIVNQFDINIYNSSYHNTGRHLIDKLYHEVINKHRPYTPATPEQIKMSKMKRDNRRHIRNIQMTAKEMRDAENKKVADEKKRGKRNVQMKRVGGVKNFQNQMKADKDAKEKRNAANMTEREKADFWSWRLYGDGKKLDISMVPAPVVQLSRNTFHYKTDVFQVCAKESHDALNYIVQESKRSIRVKFKGDSQGLVFYYALCLIRDNPDHHSSMGIPWLLKFHGEVREPDAISGNISGYITHNNKVYLCVEDQYIYAHRKLPPQWAKASQLQNRYIGGKIFRAEPHDNVKTPFLLGIQDSTAIESFSWVEGGTKYTAHVETHGKGVDYIKSLKPKSRVELMAEDMKKLEKNAAEERERNKQQAISRTAKQSIAKFCKECGKGVIGMKFCQNCGTNN